jgi:O-antigen/teichoic acid export membrane protein
VTTSPNQSRTGLVSSCVERHPVSHVTGSHDSGRLIGRVGQGSVAAFIVYSLGVGLTYCSQLIIARIVGVETYGIYAYALAWMVVLTYFSTLGFEIGLLRFVPAYEAARDWSLLKGVIQYAHRRVFVVAMSVSVVGAVIVMVWQPDPDLRDTMLAGFPLVPLLALLFIRCSIVRSFGGVVCAIAPDRVVRDGVLIAFLMIFWALGWAVSAPRVMTVTLLSATIGLACASLAFRHYRPSIINHIPLKYNAPAWRQAILPLVTLGAVEALMNRTGVILLGWIVDTKNAGIYSLVFNIGLVVTLPRLAVNTLFAPTISSMFARNEKQAMQELVTHAAVWMLLAGFCIGGVLFVVAEPLLAWFGPGYEMGVSALRILLLGQMLAAAAGSQLFIMTMTGQERAAAVLLTACAALNAFGSAALIAVFGIEGAAIGATATLVAWNVLMAILLWRRLGLVPGLFGVSRTSLKRTYADVGNSIRHRLGRSKATERYF